MRKQIGKPSDELLKLIELANLAPLKPSPLPTSEFVIAQKYFEKTGKVFPKFQFSLQHKLDLSVFPSKEEFAAHQKARVEGFNEIKEITKKFPALYHYVFDLSEETVYNIEGDPVLHDQITRYDAVLSIQELLVHISITCSVFIKRLGLKAFGEGSYFIEEFYHPFPLKMWFEAGKITFSGIDIRKILENSDLRRLRWCKNCKQIFWAYRIDAKYCSDKCGINVRVKKSISAKSSEVKTSAEISEQRKIERQNFLRQDFSDKENETKIK